MISHTNEKHYGQKVADCTAAAVTVRCKKLEAAFPNADWKRMCQLGSNRCMGWWQSYCDTHRRRTIVEPFAGPHVA